MKLLAALLFSGCVVAVESEPESSIFPHETETEPVEGAGSGNAYPNPCRPAGIKGGLLIPVECYNGPPRHDDVENPSNPIEHWVEVETEAP